MNAERIREIVLTGLSNEGFNYTAAYPRLSGTVQKIVKQALAEAEKEFIEKRAMVVENTRRYENDTDYSNTSDSNLTLAEQIRKVVEK